MAIHVCESCGRRYCYDVNECTFCRKALVESAPQTATVLAVTEISIPMLGHEDVPYWCALVAADGGERWILKSDRPLLIGDPVSIGSAEKVTLEVVGVIGTGTMGRGLAELLLSRGHHVVWVGRSQARLEGAKAKLFDRLARTHDEADLVVAETRLTLTQDYAPLSACDVVIEAVLEELEPKQAVLRVAEESMRGDALLATNTSGLPVDELASVLSHPERFGVLHFFNPATRMKLVEVARAPQTSDDAFAALGTFAVSLGKRPVEVAAKPAFAVNRALMPLLNEAVRELEEGVAPAESIDEAIRLGLNHPMGPLSLADLIGLDIVVDIMQHLAERTGDDTYEPRPLLRKLVAEGKLGRKTGAGFYTYEARPVA